MSDVSLLREHRKASQDFSRKRKLVLPQLIQIVLRRSVKPLQAILNEYIGVLKKGVSASAFSQARRKFYHTIFIELLEKSVIQPMYSDGDFKKFRGHRLLAIDGSSLRLPNTAETREEFGYIEHMGKGGEASGGQVEAKCTVLYDVLNEIPLSGKLYSGRMSDLKASTSQLESLQVGDVLLADRGYTSYHFFSEIQGKGAEYVIRCKENWYREKHGIKEGKRGDVVVTVPRPSAGVSATAKARELTIRFIQFELPSGEMELLATSLTNKRKYPSSLFKALYYKRWKVETYFHTLKSRLSIDNFSGKSVECVLQDFHAALYVSGLETMLTGSVNEELESSTTTEHPHKVNKALAFHTIKHSVMRMIFEEQLPDDFEQRLILLFTQNSTAVRAEREKPPRRYSKSGMDRRSLYFQRYARKHVF